MKSEPIITAEELLKINEGDLIFVFAGSGDNSKKRYDKSHITSAIYLDLNEDLSEIGPDPSTGGRHPLPSPEKFGRTLGSLGISPSAHLIVYDDNDGANAAARFWWMMKALGHKRVQVLSGGIKAAEAVGIALDDEARTTIQTNPYPSSDWRLPIASLTDAEMAASSEEMLLIDVRAELRYKGESEPIDPVAGHIPGAINIPFTENLDADGYFLSSEELREKYQPIVKDKDVTVHCGSGVTACHAILAITTAGLETPKLYVGSWSEWCRNDKPIAKSD
jgi:thiosulfate/3-mercaptopyruvate sulfurtransferase